MARPHVVVGGSAYRCGRLLRIYWISSYQQPTLGGPPDWVLGEVLTNHHRENLRCCEIFQRSEHGLRVFEERVLRKIFGHRKDEVTGEWRGLQKGELYDLVPLTKHLGHQIKNEMGGSCDTYERRRGSYSVLVGRAEEKTPLRRRRRDGRIILKWIFTRGGRVWDGLDGSCSG